MDLIPIREGYLTEIYTSFLLESVKISWLFDGIRQIMNLSAKNRKNDKISRNINLTPIPPPN